MMLKRGLRFDAKLWVWLAVLACVAGGSVASSQEQPAVEAPAKAEEAEEPPGPADQYGRGVPRSAMLGFLAACREGDYERAAEYLDLRRLGAKQRERSAVLSRQLMFVLDRKLWVEIEDLSQQPEGHAGDGLPSYRDRVGTLDSEEGPVDILLQRVPRDDGVSIWKISSATVARIPALLRRVRLRTARSVAAGVDAGGQPLRDRALAVARPDDVGHSRLSTLRGSRRTLFSRWAARSWLAPRPTSTTGCWRRCWGPCAL